MADTITIGQASSDLDKKAGDSNGKEVSRATFKYVDSVTSPYNWTYVFRPKDSAKAEKAATMCEKAIANNNIGYSKSGETEYGKDKAMTKLAKAVNYDLSKITTKCGLSCGDLICLCNQYAGLSTCYIGSALELAKSLKNNSNFDCLFYTKGMTLKRGDTIITAHSNGKNNHVAMILNGGNNMAKKTRVQIARDVIAGYYGSGDKRVAALKKEGYDADQVQGDVNTLLCCRENIINNMKAQATSIAANNNWWYVYWTEQYGHECAICHPHDGNNHGWQCIGFAFAVWHHGGLPSTCYCGTIADEEWEYILNAKSDADALKKAQNCIGIKDIQVIRNKNGIPKSQAKPGDIAALFVNGNDYQHTYFIMSDSKIADSTHGKTKADDIRADRNFSGRYVSNMKVLIRYTGKGLITPPKRTIEQLAQEVIDGLWGSGSSRQVALKEAGHDYDKVQAKVNELLGSPSNSSSSSSSSGYITPKKTVEELAKEVLDGKWGSGDTRKKKLEAAGYNYQAVQDKVNELLTPKKTVDQLAQEVLDGKWGSGDARKQKLTAAGYDYNAVQNKVNELLAPPKKSVDELAKEVLAGKWGSGDARKKNLESAGYDYQAVQNKVNELLKPATPVATKSIDTLAKEVLDGKWGSGDARKKNLEAAGYNYDAVQKKVNELLSTIKFEVATTGNYPGKLPSYRVVKSNAQVIADTIKWAKWIASDNRFHYGHGEHAHHNGCYFCGTQKMKKGHGIVDPDFTYCCNPFVGAAWAHGGCIPKAISMCQNYSSWDFNKGAGYDASSLFDNLGHPIMSNLKAGDVLCRGTHVALYIGGGKIAEASGGDDNKRNSSGWNNSIRVRTLSDSNYANFPRVHRYNSSVNADILMRHGEAGERVAYWQEFLDWYYDGKLGKPYDGLFGDNTLKWTKKFQEEVIGKGEGDGIVGPKTIAAAQKVVKK